MWRDPLYWYDLNARLPMEAVIHQYCGDPTSRHVIHCRDWHLDQQEKKLSILMDYAPYGSLHDLLHSKAYSRYDKARRLPEPVKREFIVPLKLY